MSDLDDFDEQLAALDDELDNVGEIDELEAYNDPHCQKCHLPLNGVASKKHTAKCQGYDGHKMDDCHHPGQKWRKAHHQTEVRLLRKRERLLKAKGKVEAKVKEHLLHWHCFESYQYCTAVWPAADGGLVFSFQRQPFF